MQTTKKSLKLANTQNKTLGDENIKLEELLREKNGLLEISNTQLQKVCSEKQLLESSSMQLHNRIHSFETEILKKVKCLY